MRVLSLMVGILTLAAVGTAWAGFEEIPIENVGMTRYVSGTANILKTSKLQADGFEMLDQPSVELMIDLDYKGEMTTLVPSDFDIKSIDSVTKGREEQTSIELHSHDFRLPMVVYVDYWCDPRNGFQQKSITIMPCKVPNVTIKRVTLDSFRFVKSVVPLSATSDGLGNNDKSVFAVVDQKVSKGFCFDFPAGKLRLSRSGVMAYQETSTSLENGFETGRFTISAVSGKPEAAFATYRQMLLETRYPELAKSIKFSALRKSNAKLFAACEYLPPCSEDGLVSAQAHIADNKGFMILFNSAAAVEKVTLPLSGAQLGLSGDLDLTDWTSLESPAKIGTCKPDGKIEIEVPAHGYKIVGVNVNG